MYFPPAVEEFDAGEALEHGWRGAVGLVGGAGALRTLIGDGLERASRVELEVLGREPSGMGSGHGIGESRRRRRPGAEQPPARSDGANAGVS